MYFLQNKTLKITWRWNWMCKNVTVTQVLGVIPAVLCYIANKKQAILLALLPAGMVNGMVLCSGGIILALDCRIHPLFTVKKNKAHSNGVTHKTTLKQLYFSSKISRYNIWIFLDFDLFVSFCSATSEISPSFFFSPAFRSSFSSFTAAFLGATRDWKLNK